MDFTDECHERVVIHIDIDYFYAQVEEIRCAEYRQKPLGVQQKNIVVTSNYIAREYGVTKLMLVEDALAACPSLVLVNGEDLTNYRRMSSQIYDILQRYTPTVEKLGFDENFIDVTKLVEDELRLNDTQIMESDTIGSVHPDNKSLSMCYCGCANRLKQGAVIAERMRNEIFRETGLTTSAGIAHNKLLAKLCGGINKPNGQTVLAPVCAVTFVTSLESLRKIPGIGEKTEETLIKLKITSIRDLQECDKELLIQNFGSDMGMRLKEISYGRDKSIVKQTGKPKSIGLEDSCKPLSLRTDVEEKFKLLLCRLMNQVIEDGRVPICIKIIVRKQEKGKGSHRETKQMNIPTSLFKLSRNGHLEVTIGANEKLIKIIMRLFDRLVDLSQSFNITLLGLAFSKFQERKTGASSIANFLMKKANVEVQSVTNLCCAGDLSMDTSLAETVSDMDCDTEAVADNEAEDLVENSDAEPSPKKTCLGVIISKRRCFADTDSNDTSSPSKLRVAELRLSSRESDTESSSSNQLILDDSNVNIPPGVDKAVFTSLPIEVQKELIESWRTPAPQSNVPTFIKHLGPTKAALTKNKQNTLHRYFLKSHK